MAGRKTEPVIRFNFFVFVLSLVVSAIVHAETKSERIDELLRQYNSLNQFNGSALVAESGKVILRKGYGLAERQWEIPNTPETKFRTGSITKQFTSALVLDLVQQGKIKLDDPITVYLPDYPKKNGDRILIRHLLSHTSGLPNYTTPVYFRELSRSPVKHAEFLKFFADADLEFKPGTRFSYSNSGYYTLGVILERVTGKTYEALLQEKILDVAGMKDTGIEDVNAILPKFAQGYQFGLQGYRKAEFIHTSSVFSAAALYSTVDDLFLWDQALYGDKVVSRATKDLMFQPVLDHYAFGWIARDVYLDQIENYFNNPFRFEGPVDVKVAKRIKLIWHGGSINGFTSGLVRLVEDRHTVILLSNTENTQIPAIATGIINILYNRPHHQPKRPIARELLKNAASKTAAELIADYRKLKKENPEEYSFSEDQLNTVGYQLLAAKRVDDAIAVFKFNVELFPNSWNPYDSLAEAYATAGKKDLAIKNYKKSLELNPENANGKAILEKLQKR